MATKRLDPDGHRAEIDGSMAELRGDVVLRNGLAVSTQGDVRMGVIGVVVRNGDPLQV